MTEAVNTETGVPKVAIIRGRMPVAIVNQVRFGNDKGLGNKDLATKYGTTVGKIDDIKKNRNFAYVTEAFRPTEAQVTEAIEWLQRHPAYATGSVDPLLAELNATPIATTEEATAFETARVAARGTSVTNKDGTVADGGGGNRKGGKGKKAEAAEEVPANPEAKPTAEALLD